MFLRLAETYAEPKKSLLGKKKISRGVKLYKPGVASSNLAPATKEKISPQTWDLFCIRN